MLVLALALAAALGVTMASLHPNASSATLPQRLCGTAKKHPRRWKHVIWIWLENAPYGEILGNRTLPYVNRLAQRCGLAVDYRAVSHPSLPNYLAATSGGTWGIGDDKPPSSHPLARASIFGRLMADGKTWRSYVESMPSNCALASSGLYAVKHNPAAYYTPIRKRCAAWDVPLGTTAHGALASALRADRLPAFSFVVPNVCSDMHSCPRETGDAWLGRWVQAIAASPVYKARQTVLFITFDEGSKEANRVATIVVSPSTPRGTRSAKAFTHYSLLKTTAQLLGIPAKLGRARKANSMRNPFHL